MDDGVPGIQKMYPVFPTVCTDCIALRNKEFLELSRKLHREAVYNSPVCTCYELCTVLGTALL